MSYWILPRDHENDLLYWSLPEVGTSIPARVCLSGCVRMAARSAASLERAHRVFILNFDGELPK